MMKTLVEIYDNEMILNLITTLNLKPEKTIFLYDDSQEKIINNKTLHRLLPNEIEYVHFSEDNLFEVLQGLRDVSFDIHGGNNLAITVVSQVANERKAPLLFPDLNTRKMYSLVDGKVSSEDLYMPKLTVKDIVGLYRASVRDLPEAHYGEEGRNVVSKIMEFKRKNNKRWVSFVKTISSINKRHEGSGDWHIDYNNYKVYRDFFDGLREVFIIENDDKGKVRFRLRDISYLPLVTDIGVGFEYDTYYQCIDSGKFDDVDIRVNIDWNGEPFNHEDPNSELDVMATKDGRLISISCKSGKYDQQAIYEVKANAVRFGGSSCIAVLAVDHNKLHPELVKKAEEIGVFLAEYKTMWNKTFVRDLLEWIDKNGYIM